MISILLIDDEISWMKSLKRTLSQHEVTPYEHIHTAQNKKEAFAILASHDVDLIFLDLNMGIESGEDLLKIIKTDYPEKTVVIMTGLTTVETAVNCMKHGADDYFTKTMKVDELIISVKRIIKIKRLEIQRNALKREYLFSDTLNDAFKDFVTASPKMYAIFKYLQAVAQSDQPILITGESGVGKGVLAKAIAALSRPDKPFITLNLAGLDNQMFSDTLFGHVKGAYTDAKNARQGMIQQAQNGTVFLDEIGELEIPSQLKLLYLTQSKEYQPLGSDETYKSEARFIFATNQDLDAKQKSGEFRKDLYFRLNTHHIHIPPLRERKEDIPLLITHFMRKIFEEYQIDLPYISDNLIPLLQHYDFPGNARQLYAVIYDAVMKAEDGILTASDFKHLFTADNPVEEMTVDEPIPTIEETFNVMINKAMAAAGGNQIKAAAILGISQPTLSRKLKKRKQV